MTPWNHSFELLKSIEDPNDLEKGLGKKFFVELAEQAVKHGGKGIKAVQSFFSGKGASKADDATSTGGGAGGKGDRIKLRAPEKGTAPASKVRGKGLREALTKKPDWAAKKRSAGDVVVPDWRKMVPKDVRNRHRALQRHYHRLQHDKKYLDAFHEVAPDPSKAYIRGSKSATSGVITPSRDSIQSLLEKHNKDRLKWPEMPRMRVYIRDLAGGGKRGNKPISVKEIINTNSPRIRAMNLTIPD